MRKVWKSLCEPCGPSKSVQINQGGWLSLMVWYWKDPHVDGPHQEWLGYVGLQKVAFPTSAVSTDMIWPSSVRESLNIQFPQHDKIVLELWCNKLHKCLKLAYTITHVAITPKSLNRVKSWFQNGSGRSYLWHFQGNAQAIYWKLHQEASTLYDYQGP